jgi:hypothetical protein
LVKAALLAQSEEYDDHYREPYTAYAVTESGMSWLFENQQRLKLKKRTAKQSEKDDLPF